MRKILITIAVLAIALSTACNKASEEAPVAQTTKAPFSRATPAPADSGQELTELAGTVLVLDSGEEVGILSIGDFDTNLNELDGLIAVEGRVAEVFADRGAFVLVDSDRMAGCSDGCCPQAEVPVRIALENFEGELPMADSQVVVVGDVTVNKLGYDLAVREIRQGEEILISLAVESV